MGECRDRLQLINLSPLTSDIWNKGGVELSNKLYPLRYTFNDGTVWEYQEHNVALTLDQINYMLKEITKHDQMELKNQFTGDTKLSGELKSIDILFDK